MTMSTIPTNVLETATPTRPTPFLAIKPPIHLSIGTPDITLPLTTTFTEAESCASSWYYGGMTIPPIIFRGASSPTAVPLVHREVGDMAGPWPLDVMNLAKCFPYPAGVRLSSSTVLFSPGVCPKQYTTAYATYDNTENHNLAGCCPSYVYSLLSH
jgi:hypothetical protein